MKIEKLDVDLIISLVEKDCNGCGDGESFTYTKYGIRVNQKAQKLIDSIITLKSVLSDELNDVTLIDK